MTVFSNVHFALITGSNLPHCFFLFPGHTPCEILIPWPGIKPGPSAVKAQSPNHQTTLRFPQSDTFLLVDTDYCNHLMLVLSMSLSSWRWLHWPSPFDDPEASSAGDRHSLGVPSPQLHEKHERLTIWQMPKPNLSQKDLRLPGQWMSMEGARQTGQLCLEGAQGHADPCSLTLPGAMNCVQSWLCSI